MDHYWLDIRYSIHDQIRWIFVIYIIECVNGTYTNILLNMCHQVEVDSLTQATALVNEFMGWHETWYTMINEWEVYKDNVCCLD